MYDYVDIGTSDFETSLDIRSADESVLLVEPLFHYLRNLPDEPRVFKANFAVSDRRSFTNIYYVRESDINQYSLPAWVRGCNSLGKPHITVVQLLNQLGYPDLITSQEVRVVTFEDLVDIYDINEIGQLKIDTEGHDHFILPSVLQLLHDGELHISTIICEYLEVFGNTEMLDVQINELLALDYAYLRQGDNITMTRT